MKNYFINRQRIFTGSFFYSDKKGHYFVNFMKRISQENQSVQRFMPL